MQNLLHKCCERNNHFPFNENSHVTKVNGVVDICNMTIGHAFSKFERPPNIKVRQPDGAPLVSGVDMAM